MKTKTEAAELIAKLTSHRDASMQCWEGAKDGAQIDEDQHGHEGRVAAAKDATESAEASWDAAIEAAEAGDFARAIEELEDARSLASEWGDDQEERAAIELLRDAQGGAK